MGPREFYSAVEAAYREAALRVGQTSLEISLADRPVQIRFASDVLADRLTRALRHNQRNSPDRNPFLLRVWDTASTGVPAPRPPWGPHDYREQGYIRGFNEDGIRTAFHIGPNVLSMIDETAATGIFWTPDGPGLPDYQVGSPFLIVLQWWARSNGLTLMHAGAVGTEHGGVLLAGAGGSGKSTTSLACSLDRRFRYASDDYCLLQTDPEDMAFTLYNTGKLDGYSASILPALAPHFAGNGKTDDEKSILYMVDANPEALIDRLPVSAILLPTANGATETTIEPVSPGLALQALAPSTVFQLTGAGSESFKALAGLSRRVPCYRLSLSLDMRDCPDRIAQLIRELA